MKDLFTLQDDQGDLTETSNIFSQLSEEIHVGVTDGYQGKQGSSPSGIRESTNQIDGGKDEETNILKSLFDVHGIHVSANLLTFSAILIWLTVIITLGLIFLLRVQ